MTPNDTENLATIAQYVQTTVEIVGLVVILFKAARFTSRVESSITEHTEKLSTHMSTVARILDDHEDRLRSVEGQAAEWRGEDRRKHPDRRAST